MALTKVNSAGVKDNEIVNADIHSAANIAGSKLADGGITNTKIANSAVTLDKIATEAVNEPKLQVSNAPVNGYFLQAQATGSGGLKWAVASSPEVYGFNTDTNGNLIVTTTNGGADNISGATYAAFEDVIYAATGFTFSVNTDGKLIATI